MKTSVSVVGLGKLGSGLAAVFADAGLRTLGIDTSEELVRAINAGEATDVEPDMQTLIRKHGGKDLLATSRHADAIEKSDTSFLVVGTPSDEKGHFSNEQLESALALLAEALGRSKKPYHLFVISSTVTPGAIDGTLIPLIERHSGRKLHQGFGICYDPEFVALGAVVHGFREPDLVVIGESDRHAGDEVEKIHRQICSNKPVIRRMSIINAELAKVALNVYLTMKITFANMLARLCEDIPGADSDVITDAIGQDRRISPLYLRGGLSFGGPCFPRDTRAMAALLRRHSLDAHLVEAVNRFNDEQDAHLLRQTLKAADAAGGGAIGVLGLSFKPGTAVIADSPAITLIGSLLDAGRKVVAYDPHAIEAARNIFGSRIQYAGSAAECLTASRVCVLANTEREFRKAVQEYRGADPKTVIDCWRDLEPGKVPSAVRSVDLGRGPQARAAVAGMAAKAKSGWTFEEQVFGVAPVKMASSEE
jgi:UDPglucose 6-dehydrogenase